MNIKEVLSCIPESVVIFFDGKTELSRQTLTRNPDQERIHYDVTISSDDEWVITENGQVKLVSKPSRYPLHLVKNVRYSHFNLDDDENDTSRDFEIQMMSPNDFFRSVCEYNGLLGSNASNILSWVHRIYGVDLRKIE